MSAFSLPGVCSSSGLLTADGLIEKCLSDSSAIACRSCRLPLPLQPYAESAYGHPRPQWPFERRILRLVITVRSHTQGSDFLATASSLLQPLPLRLLPLCRERLWTPLSLMAL